MHARYFSAEVGGFHSVDPVGGAPSWPQSWNRYSYVLGNPIKYTDPYGLQQTTVFDEIAVISQLIPLSEHPVPHGIMEAIVIARLFRDLTRSRNHTHSGGGSGGESSERGWFSRSLAGCPPWASGISLDLSTINPFSSGGGGVYLGANLQQVPGEGVGLHTYSTHQERASIGLDIGVSLTANAGIGSGPWEGESVVSLVNVGPVTFGGFGSPESQLSSGWYGLQGGVSGPVPFGAGSTSVTYTKRLDLSWIRPACN